MGGRQLGLFDEESTKSVELREERRRADRELAAKLPPHLKLGTSSWSFPGWAGLVYAGEPSEKELAERGLSEYAAHPLFATVGIDRSYYAPPPVEALQRYSSQLPPGFPCVIKAFSEITSRVHPRTREPNPHFLDAERCTRDVIEPLLAHFEPHVGALVFELMPVRRSELPSTPEFAEELGRFLSALPQGLNYVVELRNRELLSHRYFEVLAQAGAGHVLNYWERMPTIGEQLAIDESLLGPVVVCRALIPPGQRYADKKRAFAPFDRIVQVQPEMRRDIVRLSEACELLGKTLLVIVNNKAEGCSPLTVRALAESVVSARGG